MIYRIFTDGGVNNKGEGACAAQISGSGIERKIKILSYFLDAKPQEAELCAAIMSLSLIQAAVCYEGSPQPVVEIVSDSDLLCKSLPSATALPKNSNLRGLLRSLEIHSQGLCVRASCIQAHSGIHENEACDRACRWALNKGPELLQKGHNYVGMSASGYDAWCLLDFREIFRSLLRGEPMIGDPLAAQFMEAGLLERFAA